MWYNYDCKVKGIILGHAIGYALGVGLEEWGKSIKDYYFQG